MFGGALGGGKTEALLHWLKQGVHIPMFSGLFLRRTFAQLQGSPTSPIERSHRFFKPDGGVYNASEKAWKFPNGAMVKFGHMQYEADKHQYDGPEFHRIAFDQVEQFTETQYTYMFSRLRRVKGFPIPCGMRSAANPIGYPWVKERFLTDEAVEKLKGFTASDPSPPDLFFMCPNGAWFLPSRIADNLSLEVDEYIARLQGQLGPVLAARLANGDWSIVEGCQINPHWLRYYQMRGTHLLPQQPDGKPYPINRISQVRRFATVDTAGTSKQKKAEKKQGKEPSRSCCAVWDYWPQPDILFLRHMWRDLVDWTGLKSGVRSTLKEWNVPRVIIENAHFGGALAQEIRGHQVVLAPTVFRGMKTGEKGEGAKLERAIASGMISRFSEGKILLPDVGTVDGAIEWMHAFTRELLGWTGLPDEMADQIDVCSYACREVKSSAATWGGTLQGTATRGNTW